EDCGQLGDGGGLPYAGRPDQRGDDALMARPDQVLGADASLEDVGDGRVPPTRRARPAGHRQVARQALADAVLADEVDVEVVRPPGTSDVGLTRCTVGRAARA